MKKTLMLLVAVMTLAMVARPALAIVDGSSHDFINGPGALTGVAQALCEPCHVPHRPVQNVPLWAHTLSTQTFNLYNTNATYSGGNTAQYTNAGTAVNFTGTKSAACLSCHDGTVAAATGYTISSADAVWIMWDAGAAVAAGNANGLKGSHPIAVNYVNIQAANVADYNTIPALDAVKLEASLVQCSTCHSAHNQVPGGGMLVKVNTNSEICTTCHIK